MTAAAPLDWALGASAALLSAASWALSSILFRLLGEKASPLGMNLGKCALGAAALGLALLFTGMGPVTGRDFLFLGLSGLLGIALGDTLFFAALVNLGPRLALLLGALGPVFTVLMAVFFLGERPSPAAWAGIAVTIAGVNWVIFEAAPRGQEHPPGRNKGVLLGVLSILCNSAAIILAKVGVSSVAALDATFIRFLWGLAGLLAVGGLSGRLKGWTAPFAEPRSAALMLGAGSVAIFGGFWLFLVALKRLDASIAVVLNETAPLFVLPLGWLILKEKVTRRGFAGAAAAVAGVALILSRAS